MATRIAINSKYTNIVWSEGSEVSGLLWMTGMNVRKLEPVGRLNI